MGVKMVLTEQEQKLIRDSFQLVAPQAQELSESFYRRLWEIAPETKALFHKTDMVEQGRKLMQTLASGFAGLDKLEHILPAVEQLGKRHQHYGIRREQYRDVGKALLWALEQKLGKAYTHDVEAAWLKVYVYLVSAAISCYTN
jgi:hemoglobin-like flavoprotein